MKLSSIVNVLDVEHDQGRVIEVGLTTVDLENKKILKTYSLPVKVDFVLSPHIVKLTGWTNNKLATQGLPLEEVVRRLLKYSGENRLLVTDHSDEIPFIEEQLGIKLSNHRLNVAILFHILTGEGSSLGLNKMMEIQGVTPEGTPHNAGDDSRNIAKLFISLQPWVTIF